MYKVVKITTAFDANNVFYYLIVAIVIKFYNCIVLH